MKAFPAYLYAAGAAKDDPVVKKLFQTAHEVPPGKWFADRELKTPYEAPASAPVPATPEQHIKALQVALDAERAERAKDKADFEKRLAALEKKLAKKSADDDAA